jgi:Domain of unknown function (DUF4340)
MNLKFTALVLVFLVVLVGVVVFINNKPAPMPQNKLIFVTPPSDIQTLTYQSWSGPETVIQKQGDRWRITSPIEAWADDYKMQNLIDGITQLQYLDQVPTDLSAPNGLLANTKSPVITLTDGNGRTYTLNIGQQDAQGRLRVTTDSTSGRMYLVDSAWISPLQQSPDLLRDLSLANFQPDLVQTIQITVAGKTSTIIHDGASWTLTQPIHAPMDVSKIQDWLTNVQGLQAQSFASNSQKFAGFNRGPSKIMLTFTAPVPQAPLEPLVIQFGRYTDLTNKNIYADSSQNPGTAMVDAGILAQLNVDALRDHAVIRQNIDGATRIVVSWNQGLNLTSPKPATLYLVNTSAGWKLGDSPDHYGKVPLVDADVDAVQNLLSKLQELHADHFIDKPDQAPFFGLSPPWESIDIQIPGQTQDVQLDMGWPQKNLFTAFKTPDWPSLYLVKSGDTAGLTPADWANVRKKIPPMTH